MFTDAYQSTQGAKTPAGNFGLRRTNETSGVGAKHPLRRSRDSLVIQSMHCKSSNPVAL